jgi:hypothetical protein
MKNFIVIVMMAISSGFLPVYGQEQLSVRKQDRIRKKETHSQQKAERKNERTNNSEKQMHKKQNRDNRKERKMHNKQGKTAKHNNMHM